MESIHHLRAHMKSVKNIGQITKAMEMVAANKMRIAQERALDSRAYALKALDILEKLVTHGAQVHALTTPRRIATTAVVLVASDRGLAGSFTSQVIRAFEAWYAKDKVGRSDSHAYTIIAVGKKAVQYARRSGLEVREAFSGFGDFVEVDEVEPLLQLVLQGYADRRWDRVVVASMHFRSALQQEARVRQMLPADLQQIRSAVDEIIPEYGRFASLSREQLFRAKEGQELDYVIEPSPTSAVELLVPHLLRMQLYHLILEANASEHSARRVAMKNASDNASELSDELTLSYNKVRQAGITNQIVEIVSTQTALT